MKHGSTTVPAPEPGRTYTCYFNDTPLYDATVEQAQGCWATVTVVQAHPGKYEKHYLPGQKFDIKVQYYEFVEKK